MTTTTTIYREPEQDPAVLWAGAPDVATISRALAAVNKALADVEQRPAPSVPTAADLADVLELGGDPFIELPGRIDTNLRDLAVRDRETRLLRDTREHLAARLAQQQRDHVDVALAALSNSLGDVIDQARVLLPTLRGVHDSDDAINAGRVDEWQQWTALANRHQRIRATQVRLIGDALTDRHAAVQLVEKAGRFANVEDHEPVRSRIEHGEDTRTLPSAGNVTIDATPNSRPRYDDATGYLRWLCRDDVEPWLPTLSELRRKATAIDRAIQQADDARARRLTRDEADQERAARRTAPRVRAVPTTFGR